MSKHTPGPWVMSDEVESVGKLVYIAIKPARRKASTTTVRSGETVATTGVYGRNPDGSTAGKKYTDACGDVRYRPCITAEECRANALLIRAAPDLLYACQMARAFGSQGETENGISVSYLLDEAIREATGGHDPRKAKGSIRRTP